MAIHDKPFDFSEALKRTIFKGRPHFFNAKDFNKELSIIHEFVNEFNSVFAVYSDVGISVTAFSESVAGSTITRTVQIGWTDGNVLYRGVKLPVVAGTSAPYSRQYQYNPTQPFPAAPKPPEYIILTADLVRLTYADNPELCGIQSDEMQGSVPSVEVDQYQNIQVKITNDLTAHGNIICVLGTVFPEYNPDGSFRGWGYFKNTFKEELINIESGVGNVENSELTGNNTLYEKLSEKFVNNFNDRELVARFNLADLTDPEDARHNLGLSEVLNHRQLVRTENLRDLQNPALARQNLGLKSAATRRVGFGVNDVAPGNIFANDMVMMFVGSPSAIPAGWALANGSNGTKDMSARFIVGFDSTNAEYNAVGKIGGEAKVPLTIDNLPAHSHTGQTAAGGEHDHQYSHYTKGSRGEAKSDAYWRVNTDPEMGTTTKSGEHSHNLTTNQVGGNVPHENRPPYFVVAYIQYVGGSYDDGYVELSQPTAMVFDTYSDPTGATDGGYSQYAQYRESSPAVTIGSGIRVVNP